MPLPASIAAGGVGTWLLGLLDAKELLVDDFHGFSDESPEPDGHEGVQPQPLVLVRQPVARQGSDSMRTVPAIFQERIERNMKTPFP
jgi:hypothetical protein